MQYSKEPGSSIKVCEIIQALLRTKKKTNQPSVRIPYLHWSLCSTDLCSVLNWCVWNSHTQKVIYSRCFEFAHHLEEKSGKKSHKSTDNYLLEA